MPDYSSEMDTAVSASNTSPQGRLNAKPEASAQTTLEAQQLFYQFIQESLTELTQQRQRLVQEVEQLEQKRDRLQSEMQTNFAGASQDVAVRVQSFKDYLVGSLQDLATTAEQLPLPVSEPRSTADALSRSSSQRSPQPLNLQPAAKAKSRSDRPSRSTQSPSQGVGSQSSAPVTSPERQATTTRDISVVAHQMFGENAKQIRQILDQYRQSPNYYGTPWQLRRTFEPIHADRVSQWFFEQGGRGSLKTLGSRLQNVLVASAIISVLRVIHGDRLHTLILSDSPERLGEWRRGLQDCLGIARADFGGQQGVALFEAPEALTQRAERLIQQKRLPLILIDNSADRVHLSLLQYPLWLAFAPDLNAVQLY